MDDHTESPGKSTTTAVVTGAEAFGWPITLRRTLANLTSVTSAVDNLTAELSKPHTLVAVHLDAALDRATSVLSYAIAWSVSDELQIIDVATHPAYLRQGHARTVMRSLFAHAKSNGSRIALLEVRESNKEAQALYSAFGFEQTRKRSSYYHNGDDALELQLVL